MKINKIFWALSGILTLGLASCSTQTYEEYQPAQKESGSQVYFAADSQTSFNLKDYTSGSFEVPIYRVETSSAATVNLSVEADPAFTIPTSAQFSAGQNSTTVNVSWDNTKVVEAKDYTITIQILSETTKYGNSKYSFTCSKPASVVKWKLAHVTEGWWGEEEDEYIYYTDKGDGIWYCYIDNCFDTEGGAEPVKFYFTWNKNTNYLDVERQYMGWEYDTGYPVYFYDWYNFFTTDGGYAGQWANADEFYEKNGDSYPRSYYDGNGGFYFNLKYYVPGLGGWTPDQFDMVAIAEGFVRTTDFNDEKHIGASAPLYTCEVASEFFSTDGGATPYLYETGLRYTEPEDETDETTTYYLAGYFGENHCLAFTAPVTLANESPITDVENDQATGVYAFGNQIWVSVKGGTVSLPDEEGAYPEFNIVLKVYCKDADGNKTYDFGTVSETVTANGVLKDNYTIDDIYGAYFEDYLGDWTFTVTDWSNGYPQYTYDVNIADGGTDESGTKLFKITNLSGFNSYFEDVLTASYNSSYGIISIPSQQISGTYAGENIYAYILDPDASKIYSKAEIWGGICEDGALALVNCYSDVNACGFYYMTMTSGSGLAAFFNAYGFNSASSVSGTNFKKRTEYVTLDADSEGLNVTGAPVLKKKSSTETDVRSFSLSPVQKSTGRSEIPAPTTDVVR